MGGFGSDKPLFGKNLKNGFYGAVLSAVRVLSKQAKVWLGAWFGVWFGAKLSKGAKLTSKG